MPVGDKVRVLIVDDVADTRENVRKLLQFEGDIEVVGAARTAKEGIELVQELDPDVVLMDINMPDMDGIAATEDHPPEVAPNAGRDSLRAGGPELHASRHAGGRARFPDEASHGGRSRSLPCGAAVRWRTTSDGKNKAGRPRTGCQDHAGGATDYRRRGERAGPSRDTSTAPRVAPVAPRWRSTSLLPCTSDDTRVVLVDASLQYGDVAMFFNEQGKNTLLDIAPRVWTNWTRKPSKRS